MVGVNQSAVCLWETNKSHPRIEILQKLCNIYSCTFDDLLRKEGANNAEN